jgi:dUTP pyrophosphatase
MQEIELKIMKIPHEGIPHGGIEVNIPKRATSGSAGLDLCAAIVAPITIFPRQLVKIPTGIAVGLPTSEYVALVFARSGLSIKHGIALSNGVGVIDSDYTGEIIVGLCNISDEPYTIEPCERIAQLVLMPVICAKIVETNSLKKTERSDGGFGSTGRH